MFNLKIAIASILALSSSVVVAASPSYFMWANQSWEVNASALYLHPSLGGNGLGYSAFGNYAGADNQQVITTHNNINQIYNITPKEAWGFQVGGAYHYYVYNDVSVDWYHLDEGVNGHLPYGSLFSGSVDGYYAGSLQLATNWNAVNVELGHQIQLGERELLRLAAGLEYANIKNRFTNHPRLFLNGNPYFTSTDTLRYSGAGPRLGADFDYAVSCGWNLFVKTAGSLLIGTAKQSIHGYIDAGNRIYGVIPYGVNNYVSSQSNVLVPEFEAKLGANYEHRFAQGKLGLSLGYMWMTYLRSIVAYTGIGVIGSSIGVPTTTHFDLNGAFLQASWSYS